MCQNKSLTETKVRWRAMHAGRMSAQSSLVKDQSRTTSLIKVYRSVSQRSSSPCVSLLFLLYFSIIFSLHKILLFVNLVPRALRVRILTRRTLGRGPHPTYPTPHIRSPNLGCVFRVDVGPLMYCK